MNYSDTERIETVLNSLGFKKAEKESQADLIIFNSCSVRQKAEDRVVGKMKELGQQKKKLKKQGKNLYIALTGCMVRKFSTKHSPKNSQDHFVKILKPLDIAFKIEDLPKLKSLLEEVIGKKFKGEKTLKSTSETINSDYFHIKPSYSSPAQAFIPISTGCDKFCTYCIVPYSRGREISRPLKDILKEAESLVKNGCKEITLLGQTVDSYGLSNIDRQKKLFNYSKIDTGLEKPPFVQLLEKIDRLYSKGLRRLRFTSPHPKDVSQALIDCYGKLKTLMPHIHLPVQSGDNTCLKRMNRPYTRERYLEIIKALRKAKPDIAITTDIIVGFSGETEKEFKNTYNLYKEVGFDFAYLARYSVRKGTFAAKNLKDDVPNSEKARKWHLLNNLLTKITHEKLKSYLGKKTEVLVEKELPPKLPAKHLRKDKTLLLTYLGRDPYMKEVQFFSGRKNLKGTIQKVKILSTDNWLLHGELV